MKLLDYLPFKELSEWKQNKDGNWFRHLNHAKPSDITGRVAFIEKTPRIRKNFIKNEWKYGYGMDTTEEKKKWCDMMLVHSGLYTLDMKSGSFTGEFMKESEAVTYYWELGGVSLSIKLSETEDFEEIYVHMNNFNHSLEDVKDENALMMLSWMVNEIDHDNFALEEGRTMIHKHLIEHVDRNYLSDILKVGINDGNY